MGRSPSAIRYIRGYQIDFLADPYLRAVPHTQYCETESINSGGSKQISGQGAITEAHNPCGGFYSNLFLVLVVSSVGIYQDPETSISSPSGDGGTTDTIHRRYPCPGRVQGNSKESGGRFSISPTVPGFPGKLKEISIRASTDNGVPGLNSGLPLEKI